VIAISLYNVLFRLSRTKRANTQLKAASTRNFALVDGQAMCRKKLTIRQSRIVLPATPCQFLPLNMATRRG
jgi:hypothetical protein